MNGADVEQAVALVQRAAVLDACLDHPADRSTIADRAGCSRSTAYRATGELSDEGLLERTNRGYRLTGAGRATLDHVRQFVGKLQGTQRLEPLLEHVGDSAIVRRAELFTDAEIVTPQASSPYHVENRVKAVIEGTEERMLGMTAGLGSPALADAMFDRIRAGVRVEWVLPTETYDHFNTAHGDLSADAPEDGQTAVFVRDAIPHDQAVYDDTLVVIGFDHERGVLGSVAITEDEAALRWAEEQFTDCRLAAKRVE